MTLLWPFILTLSGFAAGYTFGRLRTKRRYEREADSLWDDAVDLARRKIAASTVAALRKKAKEN